jgi:hypothetical protein
MRNPPARGSSLRVCDDGQAAQLRADEFSAAERSLRAEAIAQVEHEILSSALSRDRLLTQIDL